MRTRWMGSVLALAVLLTGVALASAEVIRRDLPFEGRPVVLLLPENYEKGHDLIPLVLHLHGAVPFANAPEGELTNSGYGDLPSKYRVMVAAPQGTQHPATGLYFWNATEGCCGFEPIFGPQVDDAGYLNRLLDRLLAAYPIDPQRIYIYGYSNGAFMAHRLACDYAGRFAGIVAGAGATFHDPRRCVPAVPISVLQFHSLTDDTVLFSGGNFFPMVSLTAYPGAVETAERWAALNGCGGEMEFGKKPTLDLTTPGTVELPEGGTLTGGVEGKETTVNKVKHCPKGLEVELWTLEGDVPHPPLFFSVEGNKLKPLAEESWKFLRKHTREHDTD